MAHAAPRAGGSPDGSPDDAHESAHESAHASATAPDTALRRATALAARGRDAARESTRHLVDRVSEGVADASGALPRLAAAGAARAARARDRVRSRLARHDDHASAAEREAHRRELALEAAESGPGTDWAQVGVFSAGIAVGALIGAGAALLLAPATGYETRARLADRARRSGGRLTERWDDLGDDLRRGARRGRKKVTRAVTASRWAAEDAWERRARRERD